MLDAGVFGERVDAALHACVCVDGGESFAVAVTKEGGLLGWGSAFYGELGESDAEGSNGDRVGIPPTAIPMKPACSRVICGLNHVLALTSEGDVFAWGRNHSGQAAQPPDSHPTLSQPTQVSWSSIKRVRVVALAAGANHSLAIDACGALWSWGDNTHGQLGRLTPEAFSHSPGLVALPSNGLKATSIAAGYAHSAVVASDGSVFTFGWGLYHQLGHGSTQDAPQPRLVADLEGMDGGITAVACGSWHTAALSAQGDVYSWGWGPDGQLGPSQRQSEPLPRVVDTEDEYFQQDNEGHRAVQVVCGARFTMVRSQQGDVFCWGKNGESILKQALGVTTNSSVHSIAAGHSHAIVLKS